MRKFLLASLGIAAASLAALPALAAGAQDPAPSRSWTFASPFGTYDRASAQRGFQVYKEVCAACHSMKLLAYRNLRDLGFSEAEVKAIAAQYEATDGPNDAGEMFQRPGLPSDRFKSPFANDKAARAANNGALPPDLSLIAKARPHGPDYLYALLTGYKDAPADMKLADGMNYNPYFPGRQIAMAQPLNADAVTFADGTKATVEQMALDVTTFLMWAAEPKLEERHNLGLKVILFLIVLTGLFYAVKRKVWADLH